MKKTIAELRNEIAQKRQQIEAVFTAGEAAGRSHLLAEEEKTVNDLKAEIRGINARIEHQQEEEKRLADEAAEQAKKEAEQRGGAPHISGVKFADNDLPFRGAYALGEMLQAVQRTALNAQVGLPPDERLVRLQRVYEERAAARGETRSTKNDQDAGFIIQEDIAQDLTQKTYDEGKIASMCSERTITTNANRLVENVLDETDRRNGYRRGGITAYWVNEADPASATRPKLRPMSTNLDKLLAFFRPTQEEMEDAGALGQAAREGFVKEFAFQIDDAILRGDGAKKPLGILNAPCLISVAKETNQTAATIVLANIHKMYLRHGGTNRLWIYNRECFPEFKKLNHEVGLGGIPIFEPNAGKEGFGTLMGIPMMELEYCEAVGTKGDLMLVDFSQYRLLKKGSLREDVSIHVYFTTDELAFRWALRCGGQPIPNTPLQPYKGTATVSPFVALNTRA